jgi:hypothetical protein
MNVVDFFVIDHLVSTFWLGQQPILEKSATPEPQHRTRALTIEADGEMYLPDLVFPREKKGTSKNRKHLLITASVLVSHHPCITNCADEFSLRRYPLNIWTFV